MFGAGASLLGPLARPTTAVLRLCLQGEALFQTHENLEHLAMMERLLGPIPPHIVKKAE